jgi:hypothetical protein
MRKVAAFAVAAVLGALLPACTGDDTVQESVDGGYFPSDATAYDSTLAPEDAGEGEDGGSDATIVIDAAGPTDAGRDATATDATATDASDGGGGGTDAGNDAGVDGGDGSVDSGEDAAG